MAYLHDHSKSWHIILYYYVHNTYLSLTINVQPRELSNFVVDSNLR